MRPGLRAGNGGGGALGGVGVLGAVCGGGRGEVRGAVCGGGGGMSEGS